MKRKWRKGLAFQSWLYIVMFSLFILMALMTLQLIFLNTFYEGMKTNEVVRIGEALTKVYGSEQFVDTVREYTFRGGVFVMLLDENGENTGDIGFMSRHFEAENSLGLDLQELEQRFDSEQTDALHFKVGEGNKRVVLYIARLTNADDAREYLVLASALPAIDSTAIVLRSQLNIVMGIIMIVSLVVAVLLSRKLSAPIIEITKSAKKLAQGDLTVKFRGGKFIGGYNELNELADTLNYATAELSKTDRYQKEFIANVSHDLRTPLTLIKFYGEMIRDVSGEDLRKRTEACDTIISEADRLTEMVNELLELSRLQANEGKPEMCAFDISDCLRGIIEAVRVVSELDGFTLALDMADGLTITGHELSLRRAMYNLIGNALDYTGEDKHVTIRLQPLEGGKSGVRFEVSDTGTGIPEDEMQKVWDRYYKSGTTHKRGVIGMGIGLSIVKNVLEQHGAAYGVENLPQGGAMFWFEIG